MKKKIGILGLSGQSVFMKVPHFHAEGETLAAEELFVEPGGKGYNQAVAAARLGADVLYLTCLGMDDFGRQCLERLKQEKVQPCISYASVPTAFATILTDAAGNNRVTVYAGASAKLTRRDVSRAEDQLKTCDLLLLQLECPLETMEEALLIGKKWGIPVLLNPAPAQTLPTKILQQFDMLLPNEQEACLLLGLKEGASLESMARAAWEKGFDRMVITLGAQGAMIVEKEHWEQVPGKKVRAVDTTGAGDTFCAALAVAFTEGKTLRESVDFAITASAASVQHAHVLDGLPRREEIE